MAAGGLPEIFKYLARRTKQEFRGMHAPPGMTDEWPFKMNSQRLRAQTIARRIKVLGFDGSRQPLERCQNGFDWSGDGSWEVAADSVLRQQALYYGQSA